MWYQSSDPLHNILLSALVAGIPILFLFASLLSRKIAGHLATVLALLLAIVIAVTVFTMPLQLAGMAALFGIISGLFPIGWIVLNAVFLYNISVKSGSFAIVRNSIESVTPDRRLQALLIAFCFGAFLEGSAGFGAPVAITAGMLVGLGFEALYAAGICLIANTAPVAFGGIGIAVITAGHITNIDPAVLSKMIAHQLPFIAFIIPTWLVVIISGWKGAREIWPAILVTSISYALTMFLTASFLGPTLPDVLSAIMSIICLVSFLKVWQPKKIWRFPKEADSEVSLPKHHILRGDLLRAWIPFLILILFIGNWGIAGIQAILSKVSLIVPFGSLHQSIIVHGKPLSIIYTFGWLSAAGTAILLATIISSLLLRVPGKVFLQTAKETLLSLIKPLITIGSIVGFAYVTNYSGMSGALGSALTITGGFFPFLSPLLGWLGVFITGSDTSSNALFSGIQYQTAQSLQINPVLTVAANTSGGVAAKMISPQSIAVATASTKLVGQEGTLFRFTVLHSIGLVSIICVLSYLQAYYLKWLVPAEMKIQVVTNGSSLGTGEVMLLVFSAVAIIVLSFVASKGRLTVSQNR